MLSREERPSDGPLIFLSQDRSKNLSRYRSHGSFSYRLFICQKKILKFFGNRQKIHSPKAKEWKGKTILTLRKEEKP